MLSRRDFLAQKIKLMIYGGIAGLGIPAVLLSKLPYVTKCDIQVDSHDLRSQEEFIQSCIEQNLRPIDFLKSNFSAAQKKNYLSVRSQFVSSGRLLKTHRIFDQEKRMVTVVNVWREKSDFEEFDKLTQVSNLPAVYKANGLRLKYELGTEMERISSLMSEVYLRRANYSKLLIG